MTSAAPHGATRPSSRLLVATASASIRPAGAALLQGRRAAHAQILGPARPASDAAAPTLKFVSTRPRPRRRTPTSPKSRRRGGPRTFRARACRFSSAGDSTCGRAICRQAPPPPPPARVPTRWDALGAARCRTALPEQLYYARPAPGPPASLNPTLLGASPPPVPAPVPAQASAANPVFMPAGAFYGASRATSSSSARGASVIISTCRRRPRPPRSSSRWPRRALRRRPRPTPAVAAAPMRPTRRLCPRRDSNRRRRAQKA